MFSGTQLCGKQAVEFFLGECGLFTGVKCGCCLLVGTVRCLWGVCLQLCESSGQDIASRSHLVASFGGDHRGGNQAGVIVTQWKKGLRSVALLSGLTLRLEA